MADHNHQQLSSLRGLVVNLSKEIDYKNFLIMQKDGLSLEKFATMSCLIEEKDRLLNERSEVIGALMAQKYRLQEAYNEGMQNLEEVKLELKKVKHDLEVEKLKQCNSTGELVVYQAETEMGLGSVTTTSLNTRDKVNPQFLAMIPIMEDKMTPLKLLEDADVLMGEKNKLLIENYTDIGKLKSPAVEKDKLLRKLPASVSTSRTEKRPLLGDRKAGEPLRKKLKDSKSQNAKEQNSSKLQNGKVTCCGKGKGPKTEA